MAAASAPARDGMARIGKKELALALGWARRPPPRARRRPGSARMRQRRRDSARTSLRSRTASLVDRRELRQDLADVFAALGNDLDALPEQIAQLLGLPDEMPRIRDLIDKVAPGWWPMHRAAPVR
jgi:hypothetical protein